MAKISIIAIITILLLSFTSSGKVEKLFGELYDKDIYSGYLKTDVEGNELFYLFCVSQSEEPLKDPVLLWLNGGPGCSSMSGLLTENGPVVIDLYKGFLYRNDGSWNLKANVIYLDSPAGVGFSKSIDETQEFDDEKTAKGIVAALKNFFTEFPDYTNNEFYISGESYAGSYIPALTEEIYKEEPKSINLKGILIGNGLTNFETDVERSMVEFAYYHSLIGVELFQEFERNCPHLDPEVNDIKPRNVTKRCNDIRREIKKNLDGTDIYGIYHECRPQTTENNYGLSSREVFLKTVNKIYHRDVKMEDHSEINEEYEEEIGIWPSGCGADPTLANFWNYPETRTKLGVEKNWVECSGSVGNHYRMGEHFNFYKDFLVQHPELRVWKFSGDVDMCLCTLGTMRWIDRLNFKVSVGYKQWHCQGQVAGYVQQYDNGFTFVTIKGAGHMVPQDKRPEARVMVEAFLRGELPE